jgi:hypothetical protein
MDKNNDDDNIIRNVHGRRKFKALSEKKIKHRSRFFE